MILLIKLPFLWIFARATGKTCNRHIRKPLQIFVPKYFKGSEDHAAGNQRTPLSVILSVFLSVILSVGENQTFISPIQGFNKRHL